MFKKKPSKIKKKSYLLFFIFVFFGFFLVKFFDDFDLKCKSKESNGINLYYTNDDKDYIISTILKDVKNGTYIDVGAGNPNRNSVTKYFYNSGWRGLNIEPIKENFDLLQEHRNEDVNLNIAISDKEGMVNFYIIHPDSCNHCTSHSTLSEDEKNKALDAGYKAETIQIPTKRLDNILREHQLKTIHFMNIDVEGLEKEILESLDFKTTRPLLIVLNALDDKTQKRNDQNWSDILNKNNYESVIFDGSNVYYIAKEHLSDIRKNIDKAIECAVITDEDEEIE